MIGGTIYALLKLADILQIDNKFARVSLKKLRRSCISSGLSDYFGHRRPTLGQMEIKVVCLYTFLGRVSLSAGVTRHLPD